MGCIISLGSINVDAQVRTDRWPDAGETLLGHEFLLTGGGKGANVAFLARKLGVPARLIGRVGDDELAERALRPLRDAGVDLTAVEPVSDCSTAMSMIVVRDDGDKTIILASNANDAWEDGAADTVAKIVAEAPDGSVLVTDLEVPVDIVRRAAHAARERGLIVVLDPSPADRMTDDLYALVDAITPNPSEARRLVDVEVDSPEGAECAGQALRDKGVRLAMLKLGGGGCVVADEQNVTHIGGVEMDVVDTTGAGDAFAGALGVALLEGKQTVDAARFAVATSHLAVTGYGSQEAYPDRQSVDDLVERLPVEPQ